MKHQNMAMLVDFYEFTMSNGYFKSGFFERNVYFDVFFRSVPDKGGFAIAAGLEQLIEYIKDLHFEDEDIEYLRSKGIFDEGFLDYLKKFRFTGDIYAVPEGTPVFPNEPILTVKAPAIGTADRDLCAFDAQSSEPDRDEGEPHRQGGAGQSGTGIRFPTRAGRKRCGRRRACRLYRRMRRHGMYPDRRAVRCSRRRHDGARVGADVRQRVRGF